MDANRPAQQAIFTAFEHEELAGQAGFSNSGRVELHEETGRSRIAQHPVVRYHPGVDLSHHFSACHCEEPQATRQSSVGAVPDTRLLRSARNGG